MPDYKAILSGQSWNSLPTLSNPRKAAFLTYTFEPERPSFSWGDDWSTLGNGDRDAARQALQAWGDASGIRFIEVRGSKAELKFQWEHDWQNVSGWAEFPEFERDFSGAWDSRSRDDDGGNIYLNTTHRDVFSQSPNFRFYVLLHEIGHALGLKHPFHEMPYNKQLLGSELDNTQTTVMSYTGAGADMSTPKLGRLDIQAIQAMYGDASRDGTQVAAWDWNESRQTLTQVGRSTAEAIQGVAVKDVLKGQRGNDKLYGFEGNDVLYGGQGNDVLSGGDGKDRFVFDYWLNRTSNYDKILDFSRWDSDRIDLSSKVFRTLKKGKLSKDAFVDGPVALDENDRIIFDNEGSRVLYYDRDGTGPSAPIRVVKIADTAILRASDFYVL